MRPTRTMLTIETRLGTQTVQAWVVEGVLAVHRSWSVGGWTITHCRSGQALRTRISAKDVAIDACHHLLSMPYCDWAGEAPIPSGQGGGVLSFLRSLPLRRRNRAPPPGAEPN